MLKYFLVDGEKYPISETIERGTFDDRWPRAYLRHISHSRPWTGKPSVTQLLNGTRMEWLKINSETAIDPDESAFMLQGSISHYAMEKAGDVTETRLENDYVTGVFDTIEWSEGDATLIDYKNYGSYKAGLILGMEQYDEEIVDLSGNVERFKSGSRKGEVKTRKAIRYNPEVADEAQYEIRLQTNMYRILIEQNWRLKVEKIKCFLTPRDAGTYMAKGRGILKNTYMLDLPILPDDEVEGYFMAKSAALLHALETNELPPMCSELENWNSRRCRGYCDVAEYCDSPYKGQDDEQ